jgi:protein-disulfide isomerase
MSSKHYLLALGLGVALSALGVFSTPAIGQEGTDVVAEIGGHAVTSDDLLQKQGSKLLQARYKYYVAERDALEQYIDDEVLQAQARKESVTVDELLKRHVAVSVQEPTEEQLRFYFEGVQTDETFDIARPKILDTIHSIRMAKAKAAYITELRGQFGVVVELNQPTGRVEAGNDPRLGVEKAPVQVVEFADYECPYCQKVNDDLRRLHEQFGDRVSLVYKDYPLPMHQFAERAAEAARCAGVQGKFWEFHDSLFETKKLQVSDLKAEARTLKLDTARFDQCLDSGEQAEIIRKDVLEGQKLGLTGTPSFFVNGHFMSGAIGYMKLQETVMQELAAQSAPKKQNASLIPARETEAK